MSLYDKTRGLLEKDGYQVVFPDNQDNLCCGQPLASKGYAEQAEHKRQELSSTPMSKLTSAVFPSSTRDHFQWAPKFCAPIKT